MRRIVAPKLCLRKNSSCVRTNKQRPSTRPNYARCGKRLRDCGRSAWLATPPTRRHRPPTGRCSSSRKAGNKIVPTESMCFRASRSCSSARAALIPLLGFLSINSKSKRQPTASTKTSSGVPIGVILSNYRFPRRSDFFSKTRIHVCPENAGRCKKNTSQTITQLVILRTTDERNRTPPAVHSTGRSALVPGRPLCVIERAVPS